MRTILKWAVISICLVLILVAGILSSAHFYLAAESGARRMMTIINSSIPGTISGRTISVSLLNQTAGIRDATLIGPDGKTILKAERVVISMNLLELLKHRLVFTSIRLDRPAVTLAIEKDGQINIVSAFKEKTSKESTIKVFIKNLESTNGTLAFRLKEDTELVQMQRLRLKLSAAFTKDAILHLSIPSTRLIFHVPGREIDCDPSSLSFSLMGDRIDDIRIIIQKKSSRVTLSGQVSELSRKASLKTRLDIEVDTADLRQEFKIPGSFDGRVTGSLTMTGVYDNPNVEGDLNYHRNPMLYSATHQKSGGLGIGEISFSGALADRKLNCTALKIDFTPGIALISGDIDLRTVFPLSYFQGRKYWEALAYDLAITGNGIRLADLPGAMCGTMMANLAVKGHGIKPETLSADISGMTWVAGFSTGALKKTDLRLAGRGAYRGKTIFLKPVTASAEGATLIAQGTVNLTSRAIEGFIDLNAPRIEKFLTSYSIDAKGAASGRAMVTGTIEKPAAQVTLNGKTCAWRDIALGEVRLDASLDGLGIVTIHSGSISNHDSKIAGSGTIGVFSQFPHLNRALPVTLEVDINKVNPSDFSPHQKLEGAFSGRITASGNQSSLSGNIMVNGHDCIYADMPLGSITLDANLKEGLLNVNRLGLDKGRSSLNAAGTVRVLKDNPLSIVEDPDIDLMITKGIIFLKDFSNEASGDVALTGAIRGTVKHLQGTAALAGKGLDLGVQKLSELNLNARFDEGRLVIEPVRALIAPDQLIQGAGWLSIDGEYAFEVSSPGIALTSLDYLSEHQGLEGTAGIDISGRGTLEHPRISGRISLNDLLYQNKTIPDGRVSLDLVDHRLNITGTLGSDFRGTYDIQTRNYSAEAVFNSTDLTPLFILADKPTLQGEVSGTLRASGRIGSTQGIAVDSDLYALAISQDNKPLIQADTITGSYRNGTLVLPVTHVRMAERGKIDLIGRGTLRGGLIFDAEGTIPVEVIGAFVKEFEDAGGTIRFSSQVLSKDANTGVKALITLENCSYPIPYNGQRIHDMNGIIRMQDGLISLVGLSGRLDSGRFTLNGTAALEGYTHLKEMDVRAQAKAVPLVFPDMMDLTVDTDLTLNSVAGKPQIKADVIIIDGMYYKDVNTSLLTGVIEDILPQRKPVMSPAAPLPPFLQDMVLDVNIKRRGVMKVENNLAVLELNPDLKVTGIVKAPVVNGRISVTGGSVTFQNNTFTVLRGVIDFLNPHLTEPTLDIISQTKIRDWTISLSLEGPLDNLQVHLSSQPAQEQSDIVSLLVLGKTTRELTQQQETVKVSPSLMVAELLTSTYGSQIKKATNLDILKLEYSSLSGSKSSNDLKFTVGKELSSRITISYEMETVNSETTRTGIVSYKLFDNLLINGYPGTNGNLGAEVQYKHEFR